MGSFRKDKYHDQREALRREMKENPGKLYDITYIKHKYGIPKGFIDRELALSYAGSRIERSLENGGVRWSYVPDIVTK